MTTSICSAIRHRDMKYRRYAIGALGFIADRRSIPAVLSISKDTGEKDSFRGDALQSLYQINAKIGNKYAKWYAGRTDYLGQIAKRILKIDPELTERSMEHD